MQGTRRKHPVNLRLGFASHEYSYAIDLGLPAPGASAFSLDPQIKRECIWHGPRLRPSALLVDRRGPLVRVCGRDGGWIHAAENMSAFDSMMTHASDPRNAPEMLMLREGIRAWRFYDQFRTDIESPARSPQVGTWTPILANDGSDLAAAIQTIWEIGSTEVLAATVDDAFPGSRLTIENFDGRFAVKMNQPGLLRPLRAEELSDGTLRYLLWIAGLLSPRPPALMVLNEPETSLHPDLLGALGRLIAKAAERTQIIVVTHAAALISALSEQPGCHSIVLEKNLGETNIVGLSSLHAPAWQWPAR